MEGVIGEDVLWVGPTLLPQESEEGVEGQFLTIVMCERCVCACVCVRACVGCVVCVCVDNVIVM